MHAAEEVREQTQATFSRKDSMDSTTTVGRDALPSFKSLEELHATSFSSPATLGRTSSISSASSSLSASTSIKSESTSPCHSRGSSPLPSIGHLNFGSSTPIRLPSLTEFDLGVEALARSHGPVSPRTPPSSLPRLSREGLELGGYYRADGSIPQQPLPLHSSWSHAQLTSGAYGLPSPPLDAENRHINQKYTQEEGDFIIYAWHDKKLKWQRIKQEFAAMFGRTPERTVQGLQAWYYRMNQRIPVWDQDGWLIFDNEDDLEPRQVSIKCRDRDGQDKPVEPLGLAQRYPERAIRYNWVDPELKRKSQDWATKREFQYRERKERRKRKELRRLKL
ncbi:hypothetical protein HJFPF1_02960 [Paramyrothecium foliicola]|nr:hypothetical protein HJFPF1_02960 [Paramyrothecium foliicola]